MAMPQLVQHRRIQKITMSILEQSQTEAALYYRAPDKNLRPVDPRQQHLPVLQGRKYMEQFCYVPQGTAPSPSNTFYSVGVIQGLTKDPEAEAALQAWERRVGLQEAERIRNQAIAAGKATHALLHAHVTGEIPPPVSSRFQPYVQALEKVLPNYEPSLLSEQMVISLTHRYYGVLDQFGSYKGKLTLSDLKTSSKAKTSPNWIQDKIQQYTWVVEELVKSHSLLCLYNQM